MKGIKYKSFCIVFLCAICLVLSSCKMPENILQISSEVDFSVSQNVQISFNEHIYDTTILYNNSKLEITFVNKKELLNGAVVSLDSEKYKIIYNDMTFNGETQTLSTSFLPNIILNFLSSFEEGVLLDSFDKERNCRYSKRTVNGYIVVMEAYEKEYNKTIYSLEIK